MSQSKKENLHKKIYYPDCRAYPSKDAVLADMKKAQRSAQTACRIR